MKSRNKIVIISQLVLLILLQTGCWDQRLFEEIGFMLQMGLELNEEGNLVYSATLPIIKEGSSEKTEFYETSTQNLLRASKEELRNRAGKRVQGGKVQFIYFSKELANTGISELFDVFMRDPENPLLANVIIVDGSPREMLKLSISFNDKPLSELYAANLIVDGRARNIIPETRI